MVQLVVVTDACYSFGTVFLACDFGQRMTNAFADINMMIGQFNWYLFPLEIKKMLPTIIMSAQEPVVLEVFGSIACSREAYHQVS